MGISTKTVSRLLRIAPDLMCIDGSQTLVKGKLLDPYKKQIQELIERGFKNTQIMGHLKSMFPELSPKRTTLDDFCRKIREELYEHTPISLCDIQEISSKSILTSHIIKINQMYDEGKSIKDIFSKIKENGFDGSYSLLQQYCLTIKPLSRKQKKITCKVKRTDILSATWSAYNENISEHDILYIEETYPIYKEVKGIINEFRIAYKEKDTDAIMLWCKKYAQCSFPAICSFINGITSDIDAVLNSLRYSYNNGLLEGKVNKLKEVKRSMYGRASYSLLRAKMLLANVI